MSETDKPTKLTGAEVDLFRRAIGAAIDISEAEQDEFCLNTDEHNQLVTAFHKVWPEENKCPVMGDKVSEPKTAIVNSRDLGNSWLASDHIRQDMPMTQWDKLKEIARKRRLHLGHIRGLEEQEQTIRKEIDNQ